MKEIAQNLTPLQAAFWAHTRILFASLMYFFVIHCSPSQGIEKRSTNHQTGEQQNNSVELPSPTSTAQVTEDKDGVKKATINPNSSSFQVVTASSSSSLGNAQVSMAPGSLSIETEVSLEEGSSLATDDLSSQLGVDLGEVTPSSKAVVISADSNIDAVNPFALSIDLDLGAGLMTSDDSNLVIIYRYTKAAENQVYSGVIPRSEIAITNGIATIWTKYFGSYQAALVEKIIEKPVEQAVSTAILTKKSERELPEFLFQSLSAAYIKETHKVALKGEFSNSLNKIASCTAQGDTDKIRPFTFEIIGSGNEFNLDLLQDSSYELYLRLTCTAQDGRSVTSAWSEKILLPSKSAASISVSSISINSSALYTRSRDVSIVLTTNGIQPSAFKLGEGNSCDKLAWQAWHLSTGIAYTLTQGDGLKKICAQVVDASEVASEIAYTEIILDSTPPVITFANANLTLNAAQKLNTNVLESSALSLVWSKISGPNDVVISSKNVASPTVSATVEGVYVLKLVATDAAGNSSNATLNMTWDKTAPTVVITTPANGSFVNSTTSESVTVSGTCSEDSRPVAISGTQSGSATCTSGSFSLVMDYSSAPEGIVSILANHSDSAGNIASEASVNFNKDVTAPVVSAGIDQMTNTLYNIDANATDAHGMTYAWTKESGPGTIAFGSPTSVDTTVTADADGAYILRLTATDLAGNLSYDEMALTIDTEVPTVSITSPNAGAFVNSSSSTSVAVSGNCSENGRTVSISGTQSGSATCTAGSFSLVIDFSSAPDGSVNVYADHSDSAGNSATQHSRSFNKDTIAPVVNVGSDVLINSSISINATATDANSISGYTWTKQSGPGTINFGSANAEDTTVAASSDGVYVLRLTVTDISGNSNYDELTYSLDTVAPTLTITSHSDGSYINGSSAANLTISGSCSENGMVVYISGSLSTSAVCTSGSFTSASLDYSGLSDGLISILAEISDPAGNSSAQQSITLTKDSLPPTVNLGADISAYTAYNITPTIVDANPLSFIWSKLSGPGTVTFSNPNAAVTTITANALGVYILQLAVTDAAGNTNSDTVNFTWTDPPPATPTMNAFTNLSQTSLTINWTDVATETNYELERSPSGCTLFTLIANVGMNIISYTDSGLSANTTYCYRIRAYSSSGGYSAYSSASTTTTLEVIPSAPTLSPIANTTENSITLNWSDVTTETGYRIERATISCSSFILVTNLPQNTTNYVDAGLTPNTSYCYRVFATNTGGDSTAGTPQSAFTLLPPPASLNVTPSITSTLISWASVAGSDSYNIYWGTNSGINLASNVVPGAVTTYNHTGQTGGVALYYRVAGVAGGRIGVLSPETMAVPFIGMVAPPTFTGAQGGNYTSPQNVTLSTTTPGATIRFTEDGSDPSSTHGTIYSGPIAVSNSKIIKAIAYLVNYQDSNIVPATFVIQQTVELTISQSYGFDCTNIGVNNNTYLVTGADVGCAKGLLQFDLSGIPANAIVESAIVKLWYHHSSNTITQAVGLYKVLAPWDETVADGNKRTAQDDWSVTGLASGVDYESSYQSSVSIPGLSQTAGYRNFNIINAAQSWIANPGLNYGLLFFQSQFDGYVVSYWCSDLAWPDCAGDFSNVPKLTIIFH